MARRFETARERKAVKKMVRGCHISGPVLMSLGMGDIANLKGLGYDQAIRFINAAKEMCDTPQLGLSSSFLFSLDMASCVL